jgi:hypothetical protein
MNVARRRSALRQLCAALAFAVLGSSGCAITQRIDDHTFEIHGNAAKVDEVAHRTCEAGQVASVTQLDYKPERTGSSVIDISRSSTSCDSYGSCTRTDTRDVTPITLTIPAQQRVRVRCT